MPRLLACYACKELTKLDDYDGPPDYDFELDSVVKRHQHDGNAKGMLFVMDRSQFTAERATELGMTDAEVDTAWIDEIRGTLWQQGHPMQEIRDGLAEDAMQCFGKHGRPEDGCIDYKDDTKLLSDRKHVPPKLRRYLCEYCPVQSTVTVKIRAARGDYA